MSFRKETFMAERSCGVLICEVLNLYGKNKTKQNKGTGTDLC